MKVGVRVFGKVKGDEGWRGRERECEEGVE